MDARIGDQVGLELREVDVESPIEPQRSSDRRNDLTNQTVQVGVRRSFDVEVAATDVVDGLVIDHECAVGMLQGSVRGENRIVWLHHGG